jgi:hypothetical protein
MYIEEHTKRYLKKALRKAIKIRYACENYTSLKIRMFLEKQLLLKNDNR